MKQVGLLGAEGASLHSGVVCEISNSALIFLNGFLLYMGINFSLAVEVDVVDVVAFILCHNDWLALSNVFCVSMNCLYYTPPICICQQLFRKIL